MQKYRYILITEHPRDGFTRFSFLFSIDDDIPVEQSTVAALTLIKAQRRSDESPGNNAICLERGINLGDGAIQWNQIRTCPISEGSTHPAA